MSGDGYVLAITTENRFKSIIDLSSGWTETVGTTQIISGQWYSVVSTYDGQSIKLYVNGNLEGESAASGQVIDPVENSSFFIGVRQDLNQHFNGHIRDISIWNSTLSALQITLQL